MSPTTSTARRPGQRARRLAAGLFLLLAGASAAVALVPGVQRAAASLLPDVLSDEAPVAQPTEAAAARGLRVQVARLTRPVEERAFTGTVVARFETPLSFRVPGRILSRSVEVGDRVRTGDVLMELDPADYDEGVRAAEATLAAARAQATQALAEDARQVRLLAEGWVSQAAYDRVQAAAAAATEAVRAAEAQLGIARNGRRHVRLIAADDGVVTALSAEAGQVVAAGQPVATIIRPHQIEAEVALPEGQVDDLETWTATAELWAEPGRAIPARLREIAPEADPVGRTFRARFSLLESADLGATVTVTLRREGDAPVAELPMTALLFRDDAPMVWVVTPAADRVAPMAVTVERLGAETVRLRGLTEGARVVTLGVHRLDESLPIRIVEVIDPEGGS